MPKSLNHFQIAGRLCITSGDTLDDAQTTGEWIEADSDSVVEVIA